MTTGLPRPAERQIPAWTPTVGPGWAALLEQLHQDLITLDADYRIEAFSVKFGGLRITVCDRFQDGEFDGEFADRAAALTEAAETESEHTCEACEAPGRIRLGGDGNQAWMQARCDSGCTLIPSSIAVARPRGPAPHLHSNE
ncbi:hypothetical protein ACF1BU_31185 [Streptomyces sp. NPDC014724]|uniref:hypothetical protein n=1 Tax=unclassified Streptomyces TaxID=2593676 RepID=UPI003700567C